MSTAIQWTDETWNPVTGCTRVSEGCRNCYIERTPPFRMHGRKLGDPVQLHPDRLAQPLRWTKPRRVFVNSLSDLFHEDVPDDFLKLVLRVISAAPQHTFQVLTKRPERMRHFMSGTKHCDFLGDSWGRRVRRDYTLPQEVLSAPVTTLRLANLWLGVSVEDQKIADERIPILLDTPAAVRFVSAEPLLGNLDLKWWLTKGTTHHMQADVEGMLRNRSFLGLQHDDGRPMTRREAENELFRLHAKGIKYIPASSDCAGFDPQDGCPGHKETSLDWVIAGGESGPQARPCDVAWIRSIVEQCKAAGVACFTKQLGSSNRCPHDSKGGCWECMPNDLKVREYPHAA